jgi:uncharacterized oxidoreductase
MRLTDAILPHLLQQEQAAIMIVSSGLGFVPSALYPAYSATKAALHSYAQSLRFQLKHTASEVIELVPPYVQTEIGGAAQATDPHAPCRWRTSSRRCSIFSTEIHGSKRSW